MTISRGFVLVQLLVILLLAGAGVWGYVQRPSYLNIFPEGLTHTPTASPTDNSTATWQTYRNDKYGFEVKYPPDLRIFDATDANHSLPWFGDTRLMISIYKTVYDLKFEIRVVGNDFQKISSDVEVRRHNGLNFELYNPDKQLIGNQILSTFKFTK